MKKYYVLLTSAALLLFLSLTGFDCASTEMTSAKVYIQNKNYPKAIESLKKEVAKNPKSDEGYYTLGLVYNELEQTDSMVDAFDKSLEISNRFQKEISTAKKAAWGNNYNKAIGYFQKAVNAKTKDTSSIFYEKSATYFQSAIKAEPDSALTYQSLAYVYFNLNRPDDAIAPLTKLITLKKSADAYRHLGQLYYNKGSEAKSSYEKTKQPADSLNALANYNKAIDILEEGRKSNPGDQDILVLLSNAYISANKADVALGTFQEGVKANPENKYYRYNLAVLLLGKSQFPEAIEQFKAALAIDPEYLNSIYNLAVSYVKWGVQIQKQADEAGKDDPAIKEKYRLALPYLESYIQKKQDDAATWELIGKVYSVLSMTDDANKAFEKADKIRNKQ